MSAFQVNFTVDIDTVKIIKSLGMEEQGRVQKFIDSEVIRLCSPCVPRRNGILIKSATLATKIGSGKVVWSTPYARRWYYEPARFEGAPMRGNHWGSRAMNMGGRQAILIGVRKLVRR